MSIFDELFQSIDSSLGNALNKFICKIGKKIRDLVFQNKPDKQEADFFFIIDFIIGVIFIALIIYIGHFIIDLYLKYKE